VVASRDIGAQWRDRGVAVARWWRPKIVVPTTVETTIPAPTTTVYVEPVYYTIEPGDSLFAISKKFNLNMAELMSINNITNPDKVNAGDVIQLPVATGFVAVAPSTTMKP